MAEVQGHQDRLQDHQEEEEDVRTEILQQLQKKRK